MRNKKNPISGSAYFIFACYQLQEGVDLSSLRTFYNDIGFKYTSNMMSIKAKVCRALRCTGFSVVVDDQQKFYLGKSTRDFFKKLGYDFTPPPKKYQPCYGFGGDKFKTVHELNKAKLADRERIIALFKTLVQKHSDEIKENSDHMDVSSDTDFEREAEHLHSEQTDQPETERTETAKSEHEQTESAKSEHERTETEQTESAKSEHERTESEQTESAIEESEPLSEQPKNMDIPRTFIYVGETRAHYKSYLVDGTFYFLSRWMNLDEIDTHESLKKHIRKTLLKLHPDRNKDMDGTEFIRFKTAIFPFEDNADLWSYAFDERWKEYKEVLQLELADPQAWLSKVDYVYSLFRSLRRPRQNKQK